MKLSHSGRLNDLHDTGKGQKVGSFAFGLAMIAEVLDFFETVELTLPDNHPMGVFESFQERWIMICDVGDVFIDVHQFRKIQVIGGSQSNSQINLEYECVEAWVDGRELRCHAIGCQPA